MDNQLLQSIHEPSDLKQLNMDQLEQLCYEIRDFLIHSVAETGGHLASNLGVVELTVMLHTLFDSPRDKLVWDVGHQCYVHKMLTGRLCQMDHLRQQGGISGFCNPLESPHDCFGAGHSSTSISAALGIAMGEKLKGSEHYTIAIIGDGAMTGGLAYEGLNNVGKSGTRLIIVINDNEHAINHNVGAIADTLGRLRISSFYYQTKLFTKKAVTKIPFVGKPIYQGFHKAKKTLKKFLFRHSTFLQMGLDYVGPIDGHDLHELRDAIHAVRATDAPCILHVKTKKGKGYHYAEEHPDSFHGVAGYQIATGALKAPKVVGFSDYFGSLLCEKAAENQKLCAITAAMTAGTGLTRFAEAFPDRFFDVGIAEQHAVTFAAGLAQTGYIPVVAVYSTFLQRAYDPMLHDVGLQRIKVVFAVDRAGLVGADGATHQGIFDLAYMGHIPNLEIYAPATYEELQKSFDRALAYDGPSAVRFPKGSEPCLDLPYVHEDYKMRKTADAHILLISYGRLTAECELAIQKLKTVSVAVDLLQLIKVKPLNQKVLQKLISGYTQLYFAEEAIREGSVGQMFRDLQITTAKFHHIAIADGVVVHGTEQQQMEACGIDGTHLAKTILEDYAIEQEAAVGRLDFGEGLK